MPEIVSAHSDALMAGHSTPVDFVYTSEDQDITARLQSTSAARF